MKFRNIFFAFVFIIFLSSLVSAYLPTQEDFADSFDVHTVGGAPVYQRDIFLKLTKDGTIYQDTYYIEQDNVEAMIGFSLPKDKEFIELKILDLSKGVEKTYVPTKNIRSSNQCDGYYQIENINRTYLILLCPFKNDMEDIIKIEAFFYNDKPCGERVEKGLYFFTLKEFEILPSQKDFRLRLSAIVDNDLYYNKTAQNITCGDSSEVHYLGTGFVCDGILNLPANYSRYIDFTLGGEDKEIIAKEDLKKQLEEQWKMTNKQLTVVWIGIFLSILIAIFPNESKKFGRGLVKFFNLDFVSNIKMENSKELLKLEYENHKTYAFAEFAALLVLAFGVISNIGKMKSYILLIFTITFIALLVGFWASFTAMRTAFKKLKISIKEENNNSQKNKKKQQK